MLMLLLHGVAWCCSCVDVAWCYVVLHGVAIDLRLC